MGIADTLSDAVEEIQEYLRKPDLFAPPPALRPKLEKLLTDMDAMRAELDAMPPTPAGEKSPSS